MKNSFEWADSSLENKKAYQSMFYGDNNFKKVMVCIIGKK